jgi:sialidase-1
MVKLSVPFVAGRDGYHTYRLPVLVVPDSGTLLLLCDGRRDSASDIGSIDLVLRRSRDDGNTWGGLQVLDSDPSGEGKFGNASAVLDRRTGTVHAVYCRNLTRAMHIVTSDDGETFGPATDITDAFRMFDHPWKYFATGHVHGVQLRDGALVIPVWLNDVPRVREKEGSMRVGIIASDDHGATWRASGTVPPVFPKLNESTVYEASDGRLFLNMRGMRRGCRAISWSADRGRTWSQPKLDRNLPCPTCQATTLTHTLPGGRRILLFANPADPETRKNMSVRVSLDDGASWSAPITVCSGPSGYSDLSAAPDGGAYLAYESGERRYNEAITVAYLSAEAIAARSHSEAPRS